MHFVDQLVNDCVTAPLIKEVVLDYNLILLFPCADHTFRAVLLTKTVGRTSGKVFFIHQRSREDY